jgi:hypothetical protein
MFSEQDVDRELKAALSVSPSPDFETRVRQRVEADRPSRRATHYGWFAAAASVVVVAGVFYAMNRAPVAVTSQPAPRIVEQTAPPAVSAPQEIPARKDPGEPRRVRTVRASAGHVPAARTAEPEVIVPVNQMEAVRRLVREVNAGRLIEPPAEPQPGPMAPPPTLGVAPVVIVPIPLSPLAPAVETATPSIRGLK